MSDGEPQQQERDRDFQQRLLAAVEKPKPNRFFKFINAPLFLWALSVAFVTAGGSYFTERTECLRNAEDVAGRYAKISHELFVRRASINQIILKAGSVNDIRVGLGNLKALQPEYSSRMIPDLDAEYLRLYAQIRFTTADPLADTLKALDPLMSDEHFTRYNAINYGALLQSISDAELPAIKRFYERMNKDGDKIIIRNTHLSFSPSCSLATWVHGLISDSKPIIVKAAGTISDEQINKFLIQIK